MSVIRPIDSYDLASLEGFTSELVAAGFEPVSGTARHMWAGPIHPSFSALTQATTMRIWIRDGWPYVFPMLFVDGIHANHLTEGGYVCLWEEGDGSQEWMPLEGFFNRIEQWTNNVEHGWDARGLARDAYLNFTEKDPAVATFDLDALGLGVPGGWGRFHGEVRHRTHVQLKAGPRTTSGHLEGRWLRLRAIDVPPRNKNEMLDLLNRQQARSLIRDLEKRRDAGLLVPSGSVDLVFLCWDRDDDRHLLVFAVGGSGETLTLKALQPGPNDLASLVLRAGPDAAALQSKTVAVFGVGALGSHTALTLAEGGVGRIVLIDRDQILPGNVVRHVAGHHAVGMPKVDAVAAMIADHAPWTEVGRVAENPNTPTRVAELGVGVDLMIDTTGSEAATRALVASATASTRPLVSGALYRGGAIARVQRQATSSDVNINARRSAQGYALIPPGANDEDMVEPAVGCSAPVNNAPPSSVISCAALIAQVAVDVLTGAFSHPDEVIDIYRALVGEPPFDRTGRLSALGDA